VPAIHPPTIARPVGRRHVPRRVLVLAWLSALLVAASVLGLWIVFGANGVFGATDSANPPVLHIGPQAGAPDVATTRTTFRDLTDPEHPRVWTLERSYRTRAIDVSAIVERR
jgi:hypothetical protein